MTLGAYFQGVIAHCAPHLAHGITLYLPQFPTSVRRVGDAHGGAVVLRVVLGAVSSQKQPPQIGDSSPHEREQFRVGSLRAGNARFSLRSKGNQGIQFLYGYPLA